MPKRQLNLQAIGRPGAFVYLKAWRGARAAIYDHALHTMEAAMLAEIDTKQARDVFWKFAASEGVLAETDAA